jgi:hypothetical protein
MKSLLFTIALFVAVNTYSQTTPNSGSEKEIFNNRLAQVTSTLKLNLQGFQLSKINDLTTEYTAWTEKIIAIDLEPSTMVLSIKHNLLWQQQEINEMLTKYAISGKRIISHK